MNGITSHKQVVRHDIKLSAKIVHNLDKRVGLWSEEKKEQVSSKEEHEKKESKSSDQTTMEIEQAVSSLKYFHKRLFLLQSSNNSYSSRPLDFPQRIRY